MAYAYTVYYNIAVSRNIKNLNKYDKNRELKFNELRI